MVGIVQTLPFTFYIGCSTLPELLYWYLVQVLKVSHSLKSSYLCMASNCFQSAFKLAGVKCFWFWWSLLISCILCYIALLFSIHVNIPENDPFLTSITFIIISWSFSMVMFNHSLISMKLIAGVFLAFIVLCRVWHLAN